MVRCGSKAIDDCSGRVEGGRWGLRPAECVLEQNTKVDSPFARRGLVSIEHVRGLNHQMHGVFADFPESTHIEEQSFARLGLPRNLSSYLGRLFGPGSTPMRLWNVRSRPQADVRISRS